MGMGEAWRGGCRVAMVSPKDWTAWPRTEGADYDFGTKLNEVSRQFDKPLAPSIPTGRRDASSPVNQNQTNAR